MISVGAVPPQSRRERASFQPPKCLRLKRYYGTLNRRLGLDREMSRVPPSCRRVSD